MSISMRLVHVLFATAIILQQNLSLAVSGIADVRSPKLFRVNLDVPPKDRWLPVLDAFKENDVIPRLMHAVRFHLPEKVRTPLCLIFGKLVRFLPQEYAEEIKGMAVHLQGQVQLGELVLLNVFYDLFDFALTVGLDQSNSSLPSLGCTSILTANRDGQILHGRNLDYGWTQILKDATIVVDYVRNGKVQYTGVQFVLYSGLLTGQRPRAFTLSLNARYSGGPWDNLLMGLLTRFRHPIAFELRKVLDAAENYQEAVDRLSHVTVMAPSYIIVGGQRGDGAIITRDRFGVADVSFLDYLHHRWFLVETNNDPWEGKMDKKVYCQAPESGDGRNSFRCFILKRILVHPGLVGFAVGTMMGMPHLQKNGSPMPETCRAKSHVGGCFVLAGAFHSTGSKRGDDLHNGYVGTTARVHLQLHSHLARTFVVVGHTLITRPPLVQYLF